MGRLNDLVFKDTEFLNQPVPDQFTQRQEYTDYQFKKQKAARRLDYYKERIQELKISRKELTNVIMSVKGDKQKTQALFEEGRTMNGVYRKAMTTFLREKHPEQYAIAQQRNITDEDELVAFAETVLTPAEIERAQIAGTIQKLMQNQDKEALFRAMETHLTPEHQAQLLEIMENYRDPLDIPVEEVQQPYMQAETQALRQRAEAELGGDPAKKQQLLEALDFADSHLVKVPKKIHSMVSEREKVIQSNGAVAAEKVQSVTAKTLKNGQYENVLITVPNPTGGTMKIIAEGKQEVIADLNRNVLKVSDEMKNGLKIMMDKFAEMQILGENEVAPSEDGDKIYGFRAFNKGKKRLENALRSGNFDEIIAASEEHRKNWADMEQLYALAKNLLKVDPSLFPGNLDSCRQDFLPAHFSFDTATTAAVNGAFLVYNYLHANHITLDQYLENPVNVAFEKYRENVRNYGLDGVTQGKEFSDVVDALYDFGHNHNAQYLTHTIDYALGRNPDFLNNCDPNSQAMQENQIRSGLYLNYNNAISDLQRGRIGCLSSSQDEGFRHRTLMNLITVKHGDVVPSKLLDGAYYNEDLTRGEDFSLDHYVQTAEMDYDGMIARTDSLLNKMPNDETGLKEEILEAAQEAYSKVLTLRAKEVGTPGYQRLQAAFQELESKLPENASPEVKNRMATRRSEFEMRQPGASATSLWTSRYLDRLQNGDNNALLSQENREQINAIANALQSLKDVTAPFYEANEQGVFPTVTEEQLTNLQGAYRNVIDTIGKFVPAQNNQPAENMANMMKGLKNVLGQDLNALTLAKQGQYASLQEMLKQGRTVRVEVNGPMERFGAQASSRLRIDVPGPDGTTVKGFFTAEVGTYEKAQAEQMLTNSVDQVCDRYGHPELKEAVKLLVGAEVQKCLDARGSQILGNGDKVAEFSRKVIRNGADPETFRDLINENETVVGEANVAKLKTTEGTKIIMDVLKEMSVISLAGAYKMAGLTGNIDRRNSAMSTMADLLGMGNAIAGSRPMTVVQDGKEIKGTFMNFAEGWDLQNVNPDNPLRKMGPEDMMNPAALSSLSDLQALDFICGNTDRHMGNMFYKVEGNPPRFTGVQGIDNDYSFIVNPTNNFVALKSLGMITDKTADKIMALTPALLETTLSAYGLSKEEMDAAWTRTHQLQNRIQEDRDYFRDKPVGYVEEGHIRIMTEEQIAQIPPSSPIYQMGLFKRVLDAPKVNTDYAAKAADSRLDDRIKQLQENAQAMTRALNAVEDANRGFFIGSSSYRNALKGVREMVSARNQYVKNVTQEGLQEYAQKLNDAKTRIATYLDYKERIPEDRRSDLEKRRIDAMRKAYETLDLEQAMVVNTKAVVTVVDATLGERGTNAAEMDKFQMRRNAVDAHIKAEQIYARNSEPSDPFEGKVMKALREQARDIQYDLQKNYQGNPPTEDELAQIPEKIVTVMSYMVMKHNMRYMKDEEKRATHQMLDANPDLVEVLRQTVRNSPTFQEGLHTGFLDDPVRYSRSMTEVTSIFGTNIGKIKAEASAALKQAHDQRVKQQKAMDQPQVVKNVEDPQVEAPQGPGVPGLNS